MLKNIYLVDDILNNIYSLPETAEITIGRNKEAQICIPCASEECKRVSRIHCRLFRKDLEREITKYDLVVIDGESDKRPSKNGTYVDGIKISNKEETILKNNSLLNLADYGLRVVIEDYETIDNSKTTNH